jgi:hypothetical protein
MTPATLTCTGRLVDDAGQPVGGPCGRSITARIRAAPVVEVARAAGWAVSDPRADGSRDAMCARCRRPSTELRTLIRELIR